MGFETHMLVWEVERDVGGGLEVLQILAFRRNGAFSVQLALWGFAEVSRKSWDSRHTCWFGRLSAMLAGAWKCYKY